MSRMLIFALLAGACTASDPRASDGDLGPDPSSMAPSSTTPNSKGGELRVRQTNLASDQPGVAAFTVPRLINAWGLAVDPEPATGPEFWIAANDTHALVVVAASGAPTGRMVNEPPRPPGSRTPNPRICSATSSS